MRSLSFINWQAYFILLFRKVFKFMIMLFMPPHFTLFTGYNKCAYTYIDFELKTV